MRGHLVINTLNSSFLTARLIYGSFALLLMQVWTRTFHYNYIAYTNFCCFLSFSAGAVLEAFEKQISFIFARIFKFQHSVPKGNYHINPANPAAQWSSFKGGTQQKHFPKSLCWLALPPFPPGALRPTKFTDEARPDRLRCPQYRSSLHQPQWRPSAMQWLIVSLC